MINKYMMSSVLFLVSFYLFAKPDFSELKEKKARSIQNQTLSLDPNLCIAEEIKIDRQLGLKELRNELGQIDRDQLIQLLWNELKNQKSDKSLLLPILYYLSATENLKELRGFYKTLTFLLVGQEASDVILKHWPVRPLVTKIPISEKEICLLYQNSKAGFSRGTK